MSTGSPGSRGVRAGVNPERHDTGEGEWPCPVSKPCRCAGRAHTAGTEPSGRGPRSGPEGQARARTGTLSQGPGGEGRAGHPLGSRRLCQPPSSSPPPSGQLRGKRLRGPGGRRLPWPPPAVPRPGPPPPGAVRGADPPRALSPRLEGPSHPCPARGELSVPATPRAAAVPGVRTALRQPHRLFRAQRTTSLGFPSGCRYFPLFKAKRARSVRLAIDVCSQPLPGLRAGPGPDKGKDWRGTEAAAIRQLRTKPGAGAAKAAGREREGEKPERRGREGARPTAPFPALDRAAEAAPGIPPGPLSCRSAPVMRARLPGLLKKQRSLFLQGCSQATRPSTLGAA